ncbi:phosphopantetheine-binding protein [Phytohabitans kaempferiae]|uniref:Phosphopantetheine-binding protein n=1 Tax=Phytohabitans kaempferiae TaxID=1620943 RepID=A0ABV6MA26_9ACTN
MLTPEGLRADIADVLGGDAGPIGDDDNLYDAGLDSIRIMMLVERWQRDGVVVSFPDLAERPTLREWWAVLDPRAGERAGERP